MSFTETESYQPYEISPIKQLCKLLNTGKCQECIDKAESYLKTAYISIFGHFSAMACYKENGNSELGGFHEFVMEGLLSSIMKSGDGKSPETAFNIISPDELYAYLYLHYLHSTAQSVVNTKHGIFDRMEVVHTKSGRKHTIYFDITTQMTKGLKFLN